MALKQDLKWVMHITNGIDTEDTEETWVQEAV
jgi:hypothetical protein